MSAPTSNLRMRDKKWKQLQEPPQSCTEVRREGDTIIFRKARGGYGSIDGWGRVTWLEGDDWW